MYKSKRIKKLYSFLTYGYIPKVYNTFVNKIENKKSGTLEKNQKIRKYSTDLLKSAIDNVNKESKNVVPLSGGLDSRLLLALLLDSTKKSNVSTVTFGVPGAWDYEIGQLVAEEAGVNNIAINLGEHQFTESELLSCARGCERPTRLFERASNVLAWNEFPEEENVTLWSGFMADPLAGAHLPDELIADWGVALDYFVSKNRVTSRLTPEDFDPKSILPSSPITDSLEYTEQLDYAIRQPSFIKPTVLKSGAKTPFLRDEWISFWVRIPREERVDRKLFKRMALQAYPNLFSLPTDANYGLSLSAPSWKKRATQISNIIKRKLSSVFGWDYTNPNMNYFDFETAFRTNLRSLASDQLTDLQNRGILTWINIDDIWESHLQENNNYAEEIRLLVSLEFFLKVSDE